MPNSIPIKPGIDIAREFFEISSDFANPLEAIREAISNSYDWNAKNIWITFSIDKSEGKSTLILSFRDDGEGMSKDAITSTFWGLGKSDARGKSGKIGEKGHGTKIFLRSERVVVHTLGPDGAFDAECHHPFRDLIRGKLHSPTWKEGKIPEDNNTYTEIILHGYNNDHRGEFVQPNVKDYIYWFTIAGSLEKHFPNRTPRPINVHLKCLDKESYEIIPFGHPFPKEESNLETLFAKHNEDAADYYVKKFQIEDERLERQPEVHYQAIVYVEGDQAKRSYNPMIKQKVKTGSKGYRVADRYGIWLCKDFIPIQRVNEWITGFGSGSNAFVLLHGFINCQDLRLTANRGSVANTDPEIREGLKEVTEKLVDDINKEIIKTNLDTLINWQDEARTLKSERSDYDRRTGLIKNKLFSIYQNIPLYEPQNEAELFGLFMQVYTKRPELFPFEPVDYSINRGIDLIAKRTSPGRVGDSQYGYIELKYLLRGEFNHSFRNLRWIICWDFHQDCKDGSLLSSKVERGERKLCFPRDESADLYFLDDPRGQTKVQIIRLKEFLLQKLDLRFEKGVSQ